MILFGCDSSCVEPLKLCMTSNMFEKLDGESDRATSLDIPFSSLRSSKLKVHLAGEVGGSVEVSISFEGGNPGVRASEL